MGRRFGSEGWWGCTCRMVKDWRRRFSRATVLVGDSSGTRKGFPAPWPFPAQATECADHEVNIACVFYRI